MSNEMITRVIGRIKPAADAPFFITGAENIDAADIRGVPSNFPNTSLKNYLSDLQGQILEKTIEIKNFVAKDANNNRIVNLEKGDSKDVTLHWEINQVPTRVTVNGVDLENPEATSHPVGVVSTNQNWNIVALNAWGNSSLPVSTYVHFYNKIYCGTLSKDTVINDDVIYSMNSHLSGEYDYSFTVSPKENEYIYFIAPKELPGTPQFSINNIVYEWEQDDYTHKTQFDNIEQYVIWKHPQLIEDTITIQVTTKY